MKVWDVSTGQAKLTLRGHEDSIFGVAFSPDGRRLASVSNDRTVKLWDVTRSHEVTTLDAYVGRVDEVAFSPDGRHIASAGDELFRQDLGCDDGPGGDHLARPYGLGDRSGL